MKLRWFLPLAVFWSVGWTQPGQVAYLKYFLSRADFLGNAAVSAYDRKGKDHWIVFYNEQDLPIVLSKITASGDTLGTDILSYNNDQTLVQKYHFNQQNQLQWVELYGAQEAWSKKFREWAIPDNVRLTFEGQHTQVELDKMGHIRQMTFITVDGTPYGRISMSYTPRGRKATEQWTQLPNNKMIRRYQYSYDSEGRIRSLAEYGRQGELISEVDLTVAPADKLYRVPPPKLGNRLLEAETIIESIRQSKITLSHPATIPPLADDLLQLINGQLMVGTLIQSTSEGLKIRLSTGEVLNIPVSQISWARSRNGSYLVNRGE
ncbi:MAG: hypothetical protein GXO90_03035 [FCB group bacterium]|nr:hypothetical protein [FCB group bacterium]